MRFFTVLLAVFIVAGCAGPRIVERHFPPGRVLHLDQYRNLKDPTALNRHVAYIKKGDTIPLKLTIDSELVGLVQEQVDLVAKQKLYFMVKLPASFSKDDLNRMMSLDKERLSQMSLQEKQELFRGIMLYASRDAARWAPFNDMAAIEEVLGIEGGQMAFGVAMNGSEGVWASFSVKTEHAGGQ